ncbi:rhodanese-like domain-containing protein [Arenitalea sp.]|nr:rhodanese-like domain-containing protein [Algibacter sp.]MDA9070000.1 rhodanese-like domain-containing protein [Algibacter sp.]
MKNIFLIICIGISVSGFAQKKLSKLLKQQNTESIPYISVEALQNESEDIILLDSREEKEFKTSHLKNAIYVGYDFFNLDSVKSKLKNKNSKIVVYCSLGVRSEDVAEKLKKAGYSNVYNLYGGIFEWKNNDLEVLNSNEKPTDSIHTYSKAWSKWLKKGVKVYE